MSQYYGAPPPNQGYAPEAQNLQFYQSSYAQPVSGHATPSQASYGYNAPPAAGGYGVSSGFNSGFGGAAGISGRMGEQGGLRTGWLAALSTEGYDGEPPLLEELGIKPANIRAKVLAVPSPHVPNCN
jgi:protein YIPF5/7